MSVAHFSDSLLISPQDMVLWDFAGIDGQLVARRLFGARASQIAPFQSTTVHLQSAPNLHHSGSLLRLCEANYRVALPPSVEFGALVENLELNVWVKPSSEGFPDRASPNAVPQPTSLPTRPSYLMAVLVVPDEWGRVHIPQLATTKPLHSLHHLPLEQAAPARLHNQAVLIWRHVWNESPRFQIQTAIHNKEAIATLLGDRLRS